jgi:tetratricopeptide (TPR) repeat protein
MNQTTEGFLRIEAVFHEALEAPESARAELIAMRCGDDAELLAEVQAMLRASDTVEYLTASRSPGARSTLENLSDGRRIGPYELDRLLGRGGMGAVYLAHRADGQFEQQVAIKLIDLPLATDFFRERFRQERQILASLQHPYIARLLDGGVSGDGDLYLAMEYVDGVAIHRYCEQKQLSIPDRLRLFNHVCEAVQFAHQNLIVHRDLKPDNIFVAEDGTPRLLDFGTAKLVSPSLGKQEGDLTRQGFQSFTPQYASPEQVLGNPITTASDTYSLGVLLYRLLVGSLPYEIKELNMAEMIRVICEEPPRKPGDVLGSEKRLDPDLEAILAKALRKEPTERYRTAEQLSTDIADYLEGRPVAARRGTFRYRAAKFAQRNRLALAGAAVLAITLLAGIAGVLWQARVAQEERRKADARSADLRQLSNSLLSELDEAIKQLPGSTGVQKLLVTRVLEHLDRMAKDAQGDSLTQLDLIDAYTRLGNIQGNAYDQNLGDPAGALFSLSKALAIAEPLAASNARDHKAIRALAFVEQSRSEILFQSGRTLEAVAAMQEALKNFDLLIADPHTPTTLIGDAASAYGSLGDEFGQPGTPSLGNTAEALTAYRKAIELDNRALSIDPSFYRAKRGLAIMQIKIGSAVVQIDPEQALHEFQIGLQRADALPKQEQSNFATLRLRAVLLRKEANTYSELGQYSQANPIYDEDFKIYSDFAAQDHDDLRASFDVATLLDDEGGSYLDAADASEQNSAAGAASASRKNLMIAERLLTQDLEILQQLVQHDSNNANWVTNLANTEWRIGTIQQRLREPGDSEALSKKGINSLKAFALGSQSSPQILDQAAIALITVEPASLRDPQLAVQFAEREVAMSNRKTPFRLLTLAEAYHASGQLEKARTTAKEALALLPAPKPGITKPRIRRMLESEAHATS